MVRQHAGVEHTGTGIADPDRWVRADGADLAVTVYGDEERSILALHAGVADRRSWQWCAPAWAAAGYRTVSYDRRGFGATRYSPGAYDELADFTAVAEAVDARPAVVVGNSLGGGLAIDAALAFPQQVSALVLIGALPSGAPWELWRQSSAEADLESAMQAAQSNGDLDEVNRLEARYWLDGPDQPEGRVEGPARALMLDMNGRALRAAEPGPAVPRPEAWQRLAELSVPTLVVVGQYDECGLEPVSELMVETMPDATLLRLPGTAHCPCLDVPDQLSEAVLDFLRG